MSEADSVTLPLSAVAAVLLALNISIFPPAVALLPSSTLRVGLVSRVKVSVFEKPVLDAVSSTTARTSVAGTLANTSKRPDAPDKLWLPARSTSMAWNPL